MRNSCAAKSKNWRPSVPDHSADAAYNRSLDMLEEDDFWADEDLERDIEKDDKE